EPERHPATRHPQREAMAGRDDDPAVGRAWNRRGTTRLPSREGARTDERPAFSTLPESGGSGTGVEGRVVCLFTPPRLHEVQQAKGHPLRSEPMSISYDSRFIRYEPWLNSYDPWLISYEPSVISYKPWESLYGARHVPEYVRDVL